MSNQKLADRAANHFLEGYNCAQSVLLTMFEHWKLENDLVPRIATAFGSGIGRCGSVCGALTGSVMAIGAKYGANDTNTRKRLKTYKMAQKLFTEFKSRNGSTECRELVGYDLSNPAELEEARKSNVFEKKCTDLVKSAVKILLELEDPKQA